jgi:2-iminobutanoate/2-iminopropanoate deaminase
VRTVLTSADAPRPVGPYSHAIATDSLVFCAAQAGLDPQTGALAPGGTGPETAQALANLAAVLATDGLTFRDVVKSNLYLLDMADFGIVNEIYGKAMGEDPPARTTIGAASLPIGARIEIEMVAARR